MFFENTDDPIIACSTGGFKNTAIAIIRISGSDILNITSNFFSLKIDKIKVRYAHYCKIIHKDKIYDDIILTYFKGPNSYNGEDILELSVHGNILNINRIIDLFTDNSPIRLAYPGEFTSRALKNKKLTLNQVEGLDLLINANSLYNLDQGFSLLSGELQDAYELLYQSFLTHKSCIEFGFDFYEDIGETQFHKNLNDSFQKLQDSIFKLHKHTLNSNDNLLNPQIALIGLPNAGKSSLFNKLLSNNRAIVSDVEGTTRDFISEKLFIDNVNYSLIDTAGIRDSKDFVESLGVQSSLKILNQSFFKILVINPFLLDENFYKSLDFSVIDLIIYTHSDLDGFDNAKANFESFLFNINVNITFKPLLSNLLNSDLSGPIEPTKSGPIEPLKSGPIEPTKSGPIEPTKTGPIEPKLNQLVLKYLAISNIDSFNSTAPILSEISSKYLISLEFDPIMIKRQVNSISKLNNLFTDYSNVFTEINDISIVASELNIVGHCITELIGIISPDDILNNIFSNFCIGK